MATNNGKGIQLPSTLIRPTSQPEPKAPDQVELEESAAPADEGRGDRPVPKPRRRKPVAPSDKTGKRGVYLTDGVWDRLQYEAIRRRTTVSAIAEDVLSRNLPRFKVEREG